MIVARLEEPQQELICKLLEKEFAATTDFEFERRTLIIETTLAIGCHKEHIEMIKDDLIPNEGR
jgi:hypothetical protein